jgi:GH43 family beta-xylosidase
MVHLSRRLFLGGAAATAAFPTFARDIQSDGAIENPIVRQRADTQVFRHDDRYYMTASVPEYDRLILRRASTLAGLGSAEEVVVWRRPTSGRMAGYIWAPELHLIDDRWYIYFAAGDGDDKFRIRTYVLRCLGTDPLSGRWEVAGKLETPWDTFTLDSTVFTHRGTRYLCWAQGEPGIQTNSNLYLAPLATPTTLSRPPVRLSVPTLDWEIQGFKVNEAPALLIRNDRVLLAYSASATDARYCLGLLTAAADADLMDANAWVKSPEPVFVSSPVTRVYGPGHNSFTVDEAGRDVLVYHGRDYETIKGDPLFDPNRHTRIQRLYFGPDGTPDFGIPVGNGPLPGRFSPLDRKHHSLRVDGDRLVVGAGPLATTQFRLASSATARDAVTLTPISAPDRKVVVTRDGEVALARSASDQQSNFIKHAGLANSGGASFMPVSKPDQYLRHVDGMLRLGRVNTSADRAAATFMMD